MHDAELKLMNEAIDHLADPTTTLEIKRFDFGPRSTRWFLYAHREGGTTRPGLQAWGLCLVREENRP